MNNKSAINLSKLKRGMVFWYNPNPEIDKNNVPPKEVDGHEIKDYTMYGERPYVVVSSNEVCRLGRIVQVCPIGTKDVDKETFPYDVVYNSFSETGQSAIRCEQIRTVNSAELYRYECMIDDDIMDQVADKLRLLLDIPNEETESPFPVIDMSSEELEELIDSKLVETKAETTSMIDAAIARILNGVSAAFSNRTVAAKSPSEIKPLKVKRQIIITDPEKREN